MTIETLNTIATAAVNTLVGFGIDASGHVSERRVQIFTGDYILQASVIGLFDNSPWKVEILGISGYARTPDQIVEMARYLTALAAASKLVETMLG